MSNRSKILLGSAAAAVAAAIAAGVLFVNKVEGFLSVNQPVNGEVLVVEGWLPDYALQEVAGKHLERNYRLIVVCGGPLERGTYLTGYDTYADVGRDTLSRISGRKDIIAVPVQRVQKDRTYAAAAALRRWFLENDVKWRKIDVVTIGVHARRSWMLHRSVFGRSFSIGVVAIENQNYDAEKWWTTSQGVKTVIMETIAYLYSLIFFQDAGALSGS